MSAPPVPTVPGLPPLRPIFPGGMPPVDNIVGRDQDITRLWNHILAGSCLLNEPRRIGKSSVLTRMAWGVKPPGWHFVHTSVQGVRTTNDLASQVLASIAAHRSFTDRLKTSTLAFLSHTELAAGVPGGELRLRGAFSQSPLNALESALGAVSSHLESEGAYLAIAWDEFPDALVSIMANEGQPEASALLGVLRRFREQSPGRIRWILTGSVGLHHALRQLEASGDHHVNDLQSFPLGPLDGDWGQWLAGSLLMGAGCTFDGATMVELARITDAIPYLMHLLAGWARDHGPRHVDATDVQLLFSSAVGDLDASHQSTHLLSRLGSYYGDDTRTAEWLLDRVAASPSTRVDLVATAANLSSPPDDAKVRDLLALLDRDHYLRADAAGTYSWRYDALRRIWVQRRST